MIDWNKPIQTKSGLKAEIVTNFMEFINHQRIYLVKLEDGRILKYSKGGIRENKIKSSLNIINIPESKPKKREAWINIYRSNPSSFYTGEEFVFASKEKAENYGKRNFDFFKTIQLPEGWDE